MLGKRLLIVLAGLSAFGPVALDVYLPAFPAIATTFGVDVGSVQLTLATALVGLGVGQLIWGPTSDRYGRKRPLMAGLIIFTVASLLIAVAPSLPVMIALRLIQTIGASAGLVLSRAIVRDMYSGRELAHALSTIMTVFALAPVLAPIAGSLILLVAPWQVDFVALALFGLLCLLGMKWLPETLPAERRTNFTFFGAMRGYVGIVTNKAFLRTAFISSMGSTALFSYISSAPGVMMGTFGLPQTAFALIFAFLSLGIAAGARLNIRLLRTHSLVPMLRGGVLTLLITTSLVLACAFLGAPIYVILVPMFLSMIGISSVLGNSTAMSLDPFPRAAASAAAVLGALQMVMGAIASTFMSSSTLPNPVEMGIGMTTAAFVALVIVAFVRKGSAPAAA